ncbi:acyl-CoA desaturase [Kribbella solani]|uniref:acyl-CoA desaturase n=1 Tax=Kribbella solani TaxID=236067 RepID=UPI0029B90B5E|nr:acyl-CoA desaturase [Kribbella solani]MDX2970696.1 acyl-CoA desaturase [Kribbella solani]MDX3000325.1 acyl-CoA desaturase [Kribbella solani]
MSAQEQYASLYTDLLRTVRELGLLRRRHRYYYTRLGLVLGSLPIVALGVVLLGDSWFQLVPAVVLGLVLVQVAFLTHDSAHQQIFHSKARNEWTARILAGCVLGMSVNWWRTKHNRHHAAPNQVDKDPDVQLDVLAFTPEAVAKRRPLGRWFAARQGWLFFPLLTLEGVGLHASSLRHLTRRESSRLDLVVVVTRLIVYVAALYLLLPPGKATAFLAVQLAVFGVCLGAAFAPNHKGMPIVPAGMKLDFLRRQVLMSRNVRGGVFTDFAMGGLNYQIEHHLFPSMPRPTLRRVQPIVREYCELHGVKYTEVGLFTSYGIVVTHLNEVGLGARDPFQCPLAAQLRG